MNKNNNLFYNQQYYLERDHLDICIAETIKILLENNNFKKVLDIGCGTGKLVKFLDQNKFTTFGCDKSVIAVKLARKINKKNNIFQISTEKLPFKDKSFDMITAISVIEHLSQKQMSKFLKEIKRLLVKNGILFIVTPNFATPLKIFQKQRWFGYNDPTHINFYTPKSLINQLDQFKFSSFNTVFATKFTSNFDCDIPKFLQPLPKFIKTMLLFLLISTPLCVIRNSFWLSARKI